MNESWNVSVDNSSRTKTSWSVKNCSLRKQSTNWQSTAARARNSKRWRKWRPATLATNPGHTAFMFFPRSWHVVMGTAVTRILRCVSRDQDFSVRNGRLMTRHEQSLKSSRAHEQFVKTHEHFSKLMSNHWKAMSKIPREKCSWGFQNPHEPSWGLMSSSWGLMSSSWGPHEEKIPRDFFL